MVPCFFGGRDELPIIRLFDELAVKNPDERELLPTGTTGLCREAAIQNSPGF
jgi:hypothetical protein